MKLLILLAMLIGPALARPINCPLPTTTESFAKISQSCLWQVLKGQSFDNIKEYEPNYTLFSNGAEKRRWIYLPQNQKINTSNPDAWNYPVGTIFWKEFSLGGKKIETRVLEKIKSGHPVQAWRKLTYIWREDQTDADLKQQLNVKYEYSNHRGTYSIPTAPTSCNMCHRGAADMALGFNYLDLSGTEKPGYRLADLTKDNWATHPPAKPDAIAGSELDKKALGYLHANCASCHNPNGSANYMFYMNHVSGTINVKEENAYKRIVGIVGPSSRTLIHPGDPSRSFIYQRLSNGEMPPDIAVQKHILDEKAKSMLYEWIDSLEP